MTTTPDPQAKCHTCGNSWAWHQEERPRHPFNDGSQPVSTTFGRRRDRRTEPVGSTSQEPSQPVAWPFDPVLRQALIDKGVLTPDDLRDAEAKIRSVTSQFEAGLNRG